MADTDLGKKDLYIGSILFFFKRVDATISNFSTSKIVHYTHLQKCEMLESERKRKKGKEGKKEKMIKTHDRADGYPNSCVQIYG